MRSQSGHCGVISRVPSGVAPGVCSGPRRCVARVDRGPAPAAGRAPHRARSGATARQSARVASAHRGAILSVNVDPKELEKFSQLAYRWWDPASEFKPLHDINPLRLKWIDDAASLRGKRVLDVGCGGGILSEAMAACGANVTGIDLSEPALKVAQLHLAESGHRVAYFKTAAEDLARDEPGTFDVVTCMEVLEHVPDPASQVRAC